MENVTGELSVTGSNRRFFILNQIDKKNSGYSSVEEVPGYDALVENNVDHVIDFIRQNLNYKSVCIQAATYQTEENVIYDQQRKIVAAHGWHVVDILGKGKDGTTVLAYRYDDPDQKIYTVKILSQYGLQYLNHTEIFSKIIENIKRKNKNILDIQVERYYTYYNLSTPLQTITSENFEDILVTLCKMNSWLIENTGFVFWDFGFGSGRNYMLDSNSQIKWIDYGGAGMLRCPNFDSIYDEIDDIPRLYLNEAFPKKESLLVANSNFIMCQFLLHYEYWKNQKNTNADLYSSMLQVNTIVVDELVDMLPRILYTELGNSIYTEFRNANWTDHITWKKVGKYIRENT